MRARPKVIAARAGNRTMARIGANSEPQPETLSHLQCRRQIFKSEARDAWRELIRSHHSKRFRRQQANAIEFAPVQEHLTEPRIIRGGRKQATTPREPLLFLLREILSTARARPPASRRINLRFGKAGALRRTQVESRVMHTQGLGDARFHEPVERHSRN